MGEIKWIKLNTDVFDHRKIRYLRKLPDGNSVVLIWIMLLVLAGKTNDNGRIYLTENIPYDADTLANELDFEVSVINLALASLEKLNMIFLEESGCLCITGWNKHQNADALEKIKKQNRERKANQRSRQKLLSKTCETGQICDTSVTPSKNKRDTTVTPCEINDNCSQTKKQVIATVTDDLKNNKNENVTHVERDTTVTHRDMSRNVTQQNKNKKENKKEEKEKEREKEREEEREKRDELAEVMNVYRNSGGGVNPAAAERFRQLIERYGKEWTKAAIGRAHYRGKLNTSYIEGILRDWERNGGIDDANSNGGDSGKHQSEEEWVIPGEIVL